MSETQGQIIARIEEILAIAPELRFCQLLNIVTSCVDTFYYEDAQLLKRLDEYLAEIKP